MRRRSFQSALFLIALSLAIWVQGSNAFAAAPETQNYVTKAPRAILIDASDGSVLFSQKADELAPPASMSKLMTLAVLFRALKTGKVKSTDELLVSVKAWRQGGAPSGTSAMMIPVNTKATIDDLIKGIAVQSGNDASIAVAEGLGGSEDSFTKMMADEAKRIGLTKSIFANSTGLHDENHMMTARDLATLARYIITEYPEQYQVFGLKEWQYRKHKFFNRNPLLFLGIGADGMKTGHTTEAGYGLVGSAVQEGKRLIVVVAGHANADERKTEAAKLLEWGFKSFSMVKVFGEGEVVGRARVWGGTRMYVPLSGKGDVMISLPKYPANQRLSAEIVYKAPLKPPVKKGDQIAVLKITSTSSSATEVPLYAMEDVEPSGIAWRGVDTLVLMALRRLAL